MAGGEKDAQGVAPAWGWAGLQCGAGSTHSCRTDMTDLKGSEKNLGNTPHSDTTFFTMGQVSFGGWVHMTP